MTTESVPLINHSLKIKIISLVSSLSKVGIRLKASTRIPLWDSSTTESKRLQRGETNPSSETITTRGDESKQRDEYRAAWIRQRAASRIRLSGKSSAAPPSAQVLGSEFGFHGSAGPSNRIREYIKSRILPSSTLFLFLLLLFNIIT
ncbi:hypothetical protein E2C01_036605 [Portunus trituberculatus]|uniref:Uncharacterized protein n=1 Tax=Portunus trituberculatus TaxID=210409 RepID=A0A5B7F5Z5_PORTR|nr:hypothetical protein [Portunus trituberculatus]